MSSSFPRSPRHRRVKNTLIQISPTGEITHKYIKLHLFDFAMPSAPPAASTSPSSSSSSPTSKPTTSLSLQESKTTSPGKSLLPPYPLLTTRKPGPTSSSTPSSPVLKIGMQICFDLRFPLPATRLRDMGAHVLLYPSAFTIPTGEAGHWEILLRARALECQCWVLAAAQVGRHGWSRPKRDGEGGDKEGSTTEGEGAKAEHSASKPKPEIKTAKIGSGGGRASYGHSIIIDPWGKIIAEGGGMKEWQSSVSYDDNASSSSSSNNKNTNGQEHERERDSEYDPEILIANIDLETVERIRRGMPLEKMARRDIYP